VPKMAVTVADILAPSEGCDVTASAPQTTQQSAAVASLLSIEAVSFQ